MSVDAELFSVLLDTTVDFAKEMLAKRNDFYPFGASINADQQIALNAAYDGDEHPSPHDLYAMLEKGFAEGAADARYTAVALAANVDIPAEYEPTFADGIRVLIETPDYCRFVYLPYRLGQTSVVGRLLRKPRPVEYDEMFAVEVPHSFFTKQRGA